MYKNDKYVYEVVEAKGRIPCTGDRKFKLYNGKGQWYSEMWLVEGDVRRDEDGTWEVTTDKYIFCRMDYGVSNIETNRFKRGDYIIARQ